jgi:hypothetical protein
MILNVTICIYRYSICFLENKLSKSVCDRISGSHSYIKKTCSTHISNNKDLLLAWTYCPAGVKFHISYKISYNATVAYVN